MRRPSGSTPLPFGNWIGFMRNIFSCSKPTSFTVSLFLAARIAVMSTSFTRYECLVKSLFFRGGSAFSVSRCLYPFGGNEYTNGALPPDTLFFIGKHYRMLL